MPEDSEKIEIPEFIRLMIEPYKAVRNVKRQKPKKLIETTFIPQYSRPPNEALAAIGQVATYWSVMEHAVQMVLTRLALTTQFPALALTSDLSMDNRIRAIKALIALHRERYGYELADKDVYDALAQQLPKITSLKQKRNRIVHNIWLKGIGNDALVSLEYRPKAEAARMKQPPETLPISEILETANEIETVANGLFVIAQILPEADESWLLESLSRDKRRPHSETQSGP